jgi:hypothetical protein
MGPGESLTRGELGARVRAEGHMEKKRGTVNTEVTERGTQRTQRRKEKARGRGKRKKEAEGSLDSAIRRATIRRGRKSRVASLGMAGWGWVLYKQRQTQERTASEGGPYRRKRNLRKSQRARGSALPRWGPGCWTPAKNRDCLYRGTVLMENAGGNEAKHLAGSICIME